MLKQTRGSAPWTANQGFEVASIVTKSLGNVLGDTDPKKVIQALRDYETWESELQRTFERVMSQLPLVYTTTVAYGRDLGLVLQGFGAVDHCLTEHFNFKAASSQVFDQSREIYLFPLLGNPSPAKAKKRLKLFGFRGAQPIELFSTAYSPREVIQGFMVVGLGSSWHDPELDDDLYPIIEPTDNLNAGLVRTGDGRVWNSENRQVYYAALRNNS